MRLKFLAGLCLALNLSGHVRAQSWERLGPEGGSVVSLAADSQGGVYLGTADGHVFFSGDAALTWVLRGRVGNRLDAVVTRLVSDPRAANRLFAAVWYQGAGAGGGVFRSEDAGRTWTLAGLQAEAVRALELAPAQPDTLIAGTLTGVFRSADAGKTWERISPTGDEELRNVDSLAIDPRNSDMIYVGTYHLPWKTADRGKSWTPVTAGIIDDSDVMSLRIDASNPARLFMSACSGIYRSENQGAQWIKLQGIPYSARRTQAIVQDPGSPKTLFAGTTEGLWVTRDGGENWTRSTPKDWIVNSVVVAASSRGAERVVLGTESRGVQVSDDAGIHFAEANRGFTHLMVNQLAADRNHEGHFLMLTQRAEESLLESSNSGADWAPVALNAIVLEKPGQLNAGQISQVYGSPWGWLLRMADEKFWLRDEHTITWKEWKLRLAVSMATAKNVAPGRTRSEMLPPQTSGNPIAFTHDAALVAASSRLLRCAASGICNALKAYSRGGPIRAMWVSANGQDISVVRDGKLGISKDGGESAVWRDLPVANDQVLWLDIADSDAASTLILGTTNGLYISPAASTPWTLVRGGLPVAPVVRWLRNAAFWILTERNGGLYVSRDHGTNWLRTDRDSEHSQFTGLVWSGPRTVLAASQSEALLGLTLELERAKK